MNPSLQVLLIDDNPDDRFLVERSLQQEFPGLLVDEIIDQNGLDRALSGQHFDLVITDYQLRWTDGLTVLRLCKSRWPERPVIMFTGTGSEEIAVEAMKADLDDYVLKSPKHYARLPAAVRLVLNRAQERRARQEAEAQTHFQSSLLDQVRNAVIALDMHRNITYWNRYAEILYGWKATEVMGKKAADLIVPLSSREQDREISEVLSTKGYWEGECLAQRKDGSTFTAYLVYAAIQSPQDGIIGFVGVSTDITERKKIERELIRLERLRALGEMAGGISHNLNNILTGILIPVQLLKSFTTEPRVLREAEDIFTSALRARDLVQRLNQAVIGGTERLTPVRVNDVVQEAIQMTRARWKHVPEAEGRLIDVTTRLEEVPPIAGTQSGLNDILVNLLLNAVDAMPEGGSILIATKIGEEGVVLTVRDTGTGMDEDVEQRLFEPFFTTKMDVGTGLGLYTVYRTLTQWKGRIEVESAPGEGTTFSIFLPLWTGAMMDEATSVEIRSRQSGRVLIVEDEEVVSRLLYRVLSKSHAVDVFQSGTEALERFVPGRYDVALIDLGLPEVPGHRVAQAFRSADPSIVTVLMTGWELHDNDPRKASFDFYLKKPFDNLDEVLDVISRALTSSSRPDIEGT